MRTSAGVCRSLHQRQGFPGNAICRLGVPSARSPLALLLRVARVCFLNFGRACTPAGPVAGADVGVGTLECTSFGFSMCCQSTCFFFAAAYARIGRAGMLISHDQHVILVWQRALLTWIGMPSLLLGLGFWPVLFDRGAWSRAQIAGVNHLNAVRALEKAGFTIIRQDKHIVMADSGELYF